jgi:hypothetical protein
VLAIASAGGVFDVFEDRIFGSCMNEALPDLRRDSGLPSPYRRRTGLARLWSFAGKSLAFDFAASDAATGLPVPGLTE